MSTDTRRQPAEFLDEARARWNKNHRTSDINPATADQMKAANRDARRLMGQLDHVIDVDTGEREIALLLALGAAVDRRGIAPQSRPDRPRPDFIDLLASGRTGYCDVCDTRAHRLEEMHAQYGPYIYRARICVRCRRFAPAEPVDGNPDAV